LATPPVSSFTARTLRTHPAIVAHGVRLNLEADSLNAAVAQCRKNIGIDCPGEDHLRHFQGSIVRDATTVDDRLCDAHLGSQFTELLATAMDHADTYADLMQQRQFLSQGIEIVVILGSFARELDHKGLALKTLNVRQRLA